MKTSKFRLAKQEARIEQIDRAIQKHYNKIDNLKKEKDALITIMKIESKETKT